MEEIMQRLAQLEQQNLHLQQQLQLMPTLQPAAPSQPKLPRPGKWDGKGDMLTQFEIPVGRYLEHHGLSNTPTGVEHALAYLPPDLSLRAAHHWQQCAASGQPTPQRLEELFALIRTWRPQPDRKRAAREKLETLKHRKGKLTFYNEDFTKLAMELSGVMSAYDLNWRYVHGLQPEILREIDGKFALDATPLGDIMTLANAAEARLRQTGETVQRYHPSKFANGPTPMEVNNVEGRGFTGKCFKCGKPGHKAYKCRSQRDHASTPTVPKN